MDVDTPDEDDDVKPDSQEERDEADAEVATLIADDAEVKAAYSLVFVRSKNNRRTK
jgi:hypothetical protein